MPLYEFDKYEAHLNKRRTEPGKPYVPFQNASERAFLLWGEHCTECAAPDCYSTCDLYQPRPDRRCRRLEFGMYANPAFPGGNGPGAEMVFKRWGMLTARGNATMFGEHTVKRLERTAGAVSPVTNWIGRLCDKLFGDIRYSYLTFALLERFNDWLLRRPKAERPDAFVVECYNPTSTDFTMHLHMAVDRTQLPKSVRPDQLPPPYNSKLVIGPGYFREEIPLTAFERIVETKLPFNLSLAPDAAGQTATHLVFLTLDFVTYADRSKALVAAKPGDKPAQVQQRPAAKCVVFDLDHTLWSGVLLEGDVLLKDGVRDVLKALDERGILLSLASKNSREHAHEKLVELGIEEYFLYPQINWGRKSDSLKTIASEISIGIDTFIFVDDNPFDRDEVSGSLPEVEVLDETNVFRLLEHPRLKGSSSAEAKGRRLMYREAMVRSEAAKDFGEDYTGFLRSCEIKLEIRHLTQKDLGRVSELAQRTNQLNFSGTKYKGEEVVGFMNDPTLEKYVLEVSDKYGSYGIVGFCVARRSAGAVRVLDFMLSCRVQGKFIEQSLFQHLISRDLSTERLEINFKKTSRNAPAQAVLRKLGFDTETDGLLVREVKPGDLAVDFMEIVAPV
ncbi:MAG: HAD-IIIC family phosphatase [Bryobacterales bacterium]|nr:HAD-IIIC family phosphatase [Bryobacterales bacterium]